MSHQSIRPLHLDTRFIEPSSYNKLQALLSPILPMPGAIKDGDIAGVVLDIGVDPEGFCALEPITMLLVQENGRYCYRGWHALPLTHPGRVALAVVFAQLSTEFRIAEIFQEIVQHFRSGEQARETIQILLTPAGGIAIFCDYQERVLENRSWSQNRIGQEDVNDCMCLISPRIDSAHARLTLKTDMQPLHHIATQLFPIVWNEEDPVPLAFKAA